MSNIDSSVLIVIPAFNEELVLDKTLDALLNEVSANQVLVVSDGSTDKTADIGKAKNINLLELPFNLGVGAAMRTGFWFAKDNGFTKVIQFDADLQHQPKYLTNICDELENINGWHFRINPAKQYIYYADIDGFENDIYDQSHSYIVP